MRPRKVRFLALAACAVTALGAVLLLEGCARGSATVAELPAPKDLAARVSQPSEPVLVLGATDPAELALSASQTFFDAAPVVLLVDATNDLAQSTAAVAAAPLSAPVLLVGGSVPDDGIRAELDRLEAAAVVIVTDDPYEAQRDDPPASVGATPTGTPTSDTAAGRVETLAPDATDVYLAVDSLVLPSDGTTPPQIDSRDLEDVVEQLPDVEEPQVLTEVLALTDGTLGQGPAVATAQAAGVVPFAVPGGDPRATAESVRAVCAAKALTIVGIGPTFGPAADLAWRVQTAATGVELPGGGQLLFPGKRYVARFETPTAWADGTLDQHDIDDLLARTEDAASPYGDDSVVPTVEITVTARSSASGADENYSTELPAQDVEATATAAVAAGRYVVLGFQPGRATFLEQVRQYEELLRLPAVGVALEPERRLAGNGNAEDRRVSAAEIDAVVTYLADLTRSASLPQKMVVVHQSSSMSVTDLGQLDTSRSEVAIVLHLDTRGTAWSRTRVWEQLHGDAPAGVRWGWKVFPEDPAADGALGSLDAVQPAPDYISYQ